MSRIKPLTELRDADISRVDAVKNAANGTRFIIAKAAAGEAGLVPADTVRELIAPPPVGAPDTYLGNAGEVVKAELGSAAENDLPDSDFAYIEPGGKKDDEGKTTPRDLRHFPIQDAAHVRNALARLSTSPFEAKARPAVEAAARRLGIGEPAAQMKKETTVAITTEEAPMSIEEARTILKRAKLEKKAAKLARLVAKATADSNDKPTPQADPTAPDADGEEGDAGDGDAAADEVEKGPKAGAPAAGAIAPVSLKKAKAVAKAAKLAKRAARDQVATEKARRILAKVGRRNSSADQAHVDAIDNHAAALGATAHQAPAPGQSGASPLTSEPSLVTKAEGDEPSNDVVVGSVEDVILKAIGPVLGETRERIDAQLTEVSQQLAKVSRMALPGGPRVLVERDGSVIQAGDGERGMTFEQAALHKVAQTFPLGSVEREAIEKAGAKSAIRDLMEAARS